MRALILTLVLSSIAIAADFQPTKILDVAAGKQAGTIVTTVNPSNGYATSIPLSYDVFALSVALDGVRYTGSYTAGRHFKSSDFVVGDSIDAKMEGDNLIIKDANGKTHKGKIVRRERLP